MLASPPETSLVAPLATSDAHAEPQALLRAGSKSFWAASLLLPPRVRRRATALYGFCRLADDAVDGRGGPEALAEVEARLVRVYAGTPASHPVEIALADVVAAQRIPRTIFDALLEGFAWDIAGRRYETPSDLFAYAARVAGTVGVLMALSMDRRDPPTLARAAELGVAMQLTNVARDVGDDLARGRLYLPASWLEEAGVHRGSLLAAPRPSAALASVVARVLATAGDLYRRAAAGIPALPWDCRMAITAARRIYAAIGDEIEANGHDSVTRRAVTSNRRKLWLIVRSFSAVLDGRLRPAAPPLPEVQFLVDAVGSVTAGPVLEGRR